MKNFIINLPQTYLKKNRESQFLLHQEETFNALKNNDIVVNDTQTGSGKTRGALLYLKEIEKNFSSQYHVILYVAPVNSLISEKTEDIYKFLKKENLNYNVFPITSSTMRKIKEACKKDKYFTGNTYTNGELLTYFFNNAVSVVPYLSNVLKSILNIEDDLSYQTKPFIFLINPDILYYALFGDYYSHHKQNIHIGMLENIKYIIFDEFHYYTYFQLSSFFALLSYWKMRGFFNTSDHSKNVKVCLLSATPNQFIYETIKEKIGLQFEIVNNRSISTDNSDIIPFLSKTNLIINKISNRTRFQEVIISSEIFTKILGFIEKKKYGLILCNSIRAANELYYFFNQKFPNKFSRITGAITDKDRKKAVNSQVIIATSTVDLGFNFKRKNQPDRQNIDFLFIDHYTYDDFIQRLGRGGRVLGKSITNQETDAYLFLYDSSFNICKDLVDSINSEEKSRFEILDLIKTAFSERTYYFKFFKEYGYFIVQSFVRMFRDYSLAQKEFKKSSESDRVINDIFTAWEELLTKIFCAEDQQKYLKRLENLQRIVDKRIKFEKLCERDKQSIAYLWARDTQYRSSDGQQNGFEIIFNTMKKEVSIKELLNLIKNFKDDIVQDVSKSSSPQLTDYLYFQRLLFKALKNNFRSSSDLDITVHIKDIDEIFGSQNFNYRLMYIMQYYNYSIQNDSMQNPEIKIISCLSRYRRFYFQLDLRDGINRVEFEQGFGKIRTNQYLWRLILFKDAKLTLKFEFDKPEYPKLFKKKLRKGVIGYIVPFSWNYLKNNNLSRLSPYKLKVLFPNNNSEDYFVFFGKNALIAKSVIKEKG